MKQSSLEKFERDLESFLDKLIVDVDSEIEEKMFRLKDSLVSLYKKRLVKINHSIMELLCVKPLLMNGYDVDLEHTLKGVLSCDVYGVKGEGTLIVEIETGFVPPDHALDPVKYCKARIVSKITRYSHYSNKFALGIPPYYIVQIPDIIRKPPRYRKPEELKQIKSLCDIYYRNPPVSLEEIMYSRLHSIYVLDVDNAVVKEIDPESYTRNTTSCSY